MKKGRVPKLITFIIVIAMAFGGCSSSYQLNTSVSPDGSGTVIPASGTYVEDTDVALTATPTEGYVFDHWGGDATGTFVTATITLDSDKSVTAHFKAQYTLSISVSPDGSGTVTPTNDTYTEGTEVTLTATPASGYAFDHWSGDTSGESSTTAITIDSDKGVTAHFKVQFPISSSSTSLKITIMSMERDTSADRLGETSVRMWIEVEDISTNGTASFPASSVFLTDDKDRKWSEVVQGLEVFGKYQWGSWGPDLVFRGGIHDHFDLVIWVPADATGLQLHFADVPPILLE